MSQIYAPSSLISTFEPPFSLLVVGSSGSGKTQFCYDLTNSLRGSFNNVYLFYKEYQNVYENFKNIGAQLIQITNGKEEIQSAVNNLESLIHADTTAKLFIFDDLATTIPLDVIADMFTVNLRHNNCSVVFISHTLFNSKCQNFKLISANANYIVVFKSLRNVLQVKIFGSQIGQRKFIEEEYRLATEKPYGYLCVDFDPKIPEKTRFRSDLFSICPTVYTQH